MIWRTGRSLGRTVYIQGGSEPSDSDAVIGMLDTPALAHTAVRAVNGGERLADAVWDELDRGQLPEAVYMRLEAAHARYRAG